MDINLIKSSFIYNPVTGIIQKQDGSIVNLCLKKGTAGRADKVVCYLNGKQIAANKIPFAIEKNYIPKHVRSIDGDIYNLSISNLYDPILIVRESITQSIARSAIDYDPDTGLFTWKSSYGNKKKGSVAGNEIKSKAGKSYIDITIFGMSFKAHRLAFLIMTGSIPEQVDHDNGNGVDNRWSNLNPADKFINAKNQKLRSTNKVGIPGINYDQSNGLWRVRIGVNGKRITIGRSKDFFNACCMRKSAEIKFNYNPNHGSVRLL